jgi:hypothetical protein
MIVTFLFWNLYGRNEKTRAVRAAALQTSISRLAVHQRVDVFVFAECGIDPADLVTSLNGAGVGTYYLVASRSTRIRMFSRLQPLGGAISSTASAIGSRFSRCESAALRASSLRGFIATTG